jgi:hypothetical protein
MKLTAFVRDRVLDRRILAACPSYAEPSQQGGFIPVASDNPGST